MKFEKIVLETLGLLSLLSPAGATINVLSIHERNLARAAEAAASRADSSSTASPSALPSAQKRSPPDEPSGEAPSAKKQSGARGHAPTGNPGKSKARALTANLRDELVCMVSMVAGHIIMGEGAMKVSQQEKRFFEIAHGNKSGEGVLKEQKQNTFAYPIHF